MRAKQRGDEVKPRPRTFTSWPTPHSTSGRCRPVRRPSSILSSSRRKTRAGRVAAYEGGGSAIRLHGRRIATAVIWREGEREAGRDALRILGEAAVGRDGPALFAEAYRDNRPHANAAAPDPGRGRSAIGWRSATARCGLGPPRASRPASRRPPLSSASRCRSRWPRGSGWSPGRTAAPGSRNLDPSAAALPKTWRPVAVSLRPPPSPASRRKIARTMVLRAVRGRGTCPRVEDWGVTALIAPRRGPI